jgi:hypothetical protein
MSCCVLFLFSSKGPGGHYLWRGGRGWHRREKGWVNKILSDSKRLVKLKNKTTQGLGNKKIVVISKAWLTQILNTKKQRQQSYVNTICKPIRVTILIIFRFVRRQMVSPKKVHVQTTWNFRLQKITQAVIKLMSQKW